jgi:hypothetical protein
VCRSARERPAYAWSASTISVRESEAEEIDYSRATVLFLFNPSGAATLASVLEKVREDAPRRLRIAYAFPEREEVFEDHPWLARTDHWDAPDVAHTVSFFEARSEHNSGRARLGVGHNSTYSSPREVADLHGPRMPARANRVSGNRGV